MTDISTLGFIGLGVMGEPMCRNLAAKGGLPVVAHDLRAEPLERLAGHGVSRAASVGEVAAAAELVFLSLPGGEEVREVCLGKDGILARARAGTTVVDLSTTPVALARQVAAACSAKGLGFADAPVARTRAAAAAGTLSIMAGGQSEAFARIRPFLAHMGSEITHCGPVGAGQTVKLMNNMVVFQTVVALSEALAVARRAGIDGRLLFETLAKGSADSFALRNHGLKYLLPGDFPEAAFPVRYALKDLGYALELAEDGGIRANGALVARELLTKAVEKDFADNYFPIILNVIDEESKGPAPPVSAT